MALSPRLRSLLDSHGAVLRDTVAERFTSVIEVANIADDGEEFLTFLPSAVEAGVAESAKHLWAQAELLCAKRARAPLSPPARLLVAVPSLWPQVPAAQDEPRRRPELLPARRRGQATELVPPEDV